MGYLMSFEKQKGRCCCPQCVRGGVDSEAAENICSIADVSRGADPTRKRAAMSHQPRVRREARARWSPGTRWLSPGRSGGLSSSLFPSPKTGESCRKSFPTAPLPNSWKGSFWSPADSRHSRDGRDRCVSSPARCLCSPQLRGALEGVMWGI